MKATPQTRPKGYISLFDVFIARCVSDSASEFGCHHKTSSMLATAWFRSSDNQAALTTLEIPFTYCELDNTFPDYMKAADHGYVSADSASFVLPTHITFVASSSFDCDFISRP